MYIKPETNKLFISHSEIRSAFPNVSFPSQMNDAILAEHGVFPVITLAAPDFDSKTHTTDLTEPVFNSVSNQWERSHVVRTYNQYETSAKATEVRAERGRKLAATDWMVIKHLELNENIPSVWEVYRQSLRDVPQQAGFPWDVVWPVAPDA